MKMYLGMALIIVSFTSNAFAVTTIDPITGKATVTFADDDAYKAMKQTVPQLEAKAKAEKLERNKSGVAAGALGIASASLVGASRLAKPNTSRMLKAAVSMKRPGVTALGLGVAAAGAAAVGYGGPSLTASLIEKSPAEAVSAGLLVVGGSAAVSVGAIAATFPSSTLSARVRIPVPGARALALGAASLSAVASVALASNAATHQSQARISAINAQDRTMVGEALLNQADVDFRVTDRRDPKKHNTIEPHRIAIMLINNGNGAYIRGSSSLQNQQNGADFRTEFEKANGAAETRSMTAM